MPNAGNARDTILSLTSATGSVALVIGKSVAESSNVSGFGWIELENAKKVLQFFPHTGKARALDTLKPDRKSTRLNSSHVSESRMPSSA